MFATLKKVWIWILNLITRAPAKGSIWSILLTAVGSKALSILTDPQLQKLAWNTAVSLHKDDSLTTAAKAVKFNETLFAFIKENHLSNVTTSAVNTLRELACQAIAIKQENGEAIEVQA